MKPAAKNMVLAAVLAAEVALTLALTPDYSRPNVEFLPDMAHQPRSNAFAENPYLPDHATLQQPPAGTIPRGLAPMPFGASAEGAKLAGAKLSAPIPEGRRKAAVLRGKELFGRLCVPCHGAAGAGDGPVALRGFPPPPSLTVAHAANLLDGRVFHILSHGQGNMPSYASQIGREDRWRLVLFLRSLQEKAQREQEQQALEQRKQQDQQQQAGQTKEEQP